MVGPRRLMAQSAAVKSPVFSYRFNQVSRAPATCFLSLAHTHPDAGHPKHVDGDRSEFAYTFLLFEGTLADPRPFAGYALPSEISLASTRRRCPDASLLNRK